LSYIVRLFHGEEQDDENDREEHGRDVEDPDVPGILRYEAADDRIEVTGSGNCKGVYGYVEASLMGKVLEDSISTLR
jgi:hypothetical protein